MSRSRASSIPGWTCVRQSWVDSRLSVCVWQASKDAHLHVCAAGCERLTGCTSVWQTSNELAELAARSQAASADLESEAASHKETKLELAAARDEAAAAAAVRADLQV